MQFHIISSITIEVLLIVSLFSNDVIGDISRGRKLKVLNILQTANM